MEGHDATDDARLAARIAAGDEAAFVIAYDRHVGFVFSSVSRFLGDRELAAEVVQDAFMTLWRRAATYEATAGSMLTWLLAVARHRAIDRMRAEGRRPSRDSVPLEGIVAEGGSRPSSGTSEVPHELIAGSASDPGTVATRRWVQSVVRTGIAELPDHERQVIVLGYTHDLSQSQIAERLEWPLGTVKSRTRRAMAQLRARLGGIVDLDEGLEPDVRLAAVVQGPEDRAGGRR